MRASKGVTSPIKALMGFRPNVLKRRLNHTTSGFNFQMASRSRTELVGSSIDQQRCTEKPSSSGWDGEILSARIVRLINGLRRNSSAM
jgi:hypothetical protein